MDNFKKLKMVALSHQLHAIDYFIKLSTVCIADEFNSFSIE